MKQLVWSLGMIFILMFWSGVFYTIYRLWPKPDPHVFCIIGEAEDQDYWGMFAVAHALRNRSTLKGCYGLNSVRVNKRLYSKEIFDQAQMAWFDSKYTSDITNGATHWCTKELWDKTKYDGGSVSNHSWLHHCRVTYTYKDHVFLKEITDESK